jgi:WhiB family transcriptional regulator, redox-sensing transcriptional regulator
MSGRHTENLSLFSRGAYPSFYDDPDADTRACLGTPHEWWFSNGEVGQSAQIGKAKATCRRCPLLDQCKEWALSRPTSEVHGIWGGMTQYEREQHRLKAAPEKCSRCNRTIRRVDGRMARHKTMTSFGGGWVWCE